jgi:Mannitol dehydrogenase Rossmann domain
VLHLGLGSFHRAHQAVYLQRLIDAGDTRWSISGANIRPDMAEVVEALRAQGGRYTLETVSPAGEYRYARRPDRARRRAVDAYRLVHRHRGRLLPRHQGPARPVLRRPGGRHRACRQG